MNRRNTRRPGQENRGQQMTRVRVQLTTALEAHDTVGENGEPTGRWAMAYKCRWGGTTYSPTTKEIRVWDPWEENGYPDYEADAEVYVTYVRSAKRWEIIDGPCLPTEGVL